MDCFTSFAMTTWGYREPHVPVRLLEPRLEQRPRTPEATAPYALHSVASRQRLLRRPRPRPLRGYAGASPRPFAAARLARSGRSPRFQEAPPSCTARRSEEHTSELQSLMRISYDVFCLIKNNKQTLNNMYISD